MIDVARYGAYRTWDQVQAAVAAVADAHPELTERLTIGRTVNRIPIPAIRVARKGEPVRVPALVIAAIHAMEWIGVETILALLARVASDMAAGGLPGRSVTFVPILNPDGYLHVQADLEAHRPRFTRRNGHRVDLNRNFETHFDPRQRILDPFFAQGPEPFSEPETRALREVAESVRPQRFLSLHSYGGWFLYPYTGNRRPPPDEPLYQRVGAEMRALQSRYPYRVMRIGKLPKMIWARGSEIDWFRDRYGALSYLVEISKGGLEARRPLRTLDPFCWFNPRDVATEVANVLPALHHVIACEI